MTQRKPMEEPKRVINVGKIEYGIEKTTYPLFLAHRTDGSAQIFFSGVAQWVENGYYSVRSDNGPAYIDSNGALGWLKRGRERWEAITFHEDEDEGN